LNPFCNRPKMTSTSVRVHTRVNRLPENHICSNLLRYLGSPNFIVSPLSSKVVLAQLQPSSDSVVSYVKQLPMDVVVMCGLTAPFLLPIGFRDCQTLCALSVRYVEDSYPLPLCFFSGPNTFLQFISRVPPCPATGLKCCNSHLDTFHFRRHFSLPNPNRQ